MLCKYNELLYVYNRPQVEVSETKMYLVLVLIRVSFFWWKSLCRVRLIATPWTIQSMQFSRPEYWNGLPFPSQGALPNPGIDPRSPALQVDSLSAEPPGKPLVHQGFPGLPWPTVTSFSLLGCISHSVKYRMDEATHVTTSSLKKSTATCTPAFSLQFAFLLERRKRIHSPKLCCRV